MGADRIELPFWYAVPCVEVELEPLKLAPPKSFTLCIEPSLNTTPPFETPLPPDDIVDANDCGVMLVLADSTTERKRLDPALDSPAGTSSADLSFPLLLLLPFVFDGSPFPSFVISVGVSAEV